MRWGELRAPPIPDDAEIERVRIEQWDANADWEVKVDLHRGGGRPIVLGRRATVDGASRR